VHARPAGSSPYKADSAVVTYGAMEVAVDTESGGQQASTGSAQRLLKVQGSIWCDWCLGSSTWAEHHDTVQRMQRHHVPAWCVVVTASQPWARALLCQV
jgi:hypothetical protein